MTRWIVCFDGTWNDEDGSFGDPATVTNVVRFLRSLHDTPGQRAWYDAGVGTGILEWLRGGVFGRGLDRNIQQGYKWLSRNHRPGDEIAIFGFSRGAYSARSLAGLIRRTGLVHWGVLDDDPRNIEDEHGAIARAYAIYRARVPSCAYDGDEAREFRRHWSREVEIAMIGVWDTVGALGIPGDLLDDIDERRYGFHDMRLGPNVLRARQALAIDEHRKDYDATLWEPDPRVRQLWFAGAHADVGGGYADHALADVALHWMQQEAIAAGIALDPIPAPAVTGRERIHDSFAEFLGGRYAKLQGGRRHHRKVDRTCLHPSVAVRLACGAGYCLPD